jgi:hypothetical protein
MNSYPMDTSLRLTGTFTIVSSGALADPTIVTSTLVDPNGTTTTPTTTRNSLGVFYIDVTPTVYGIWTYRFNGTGAVVAQGEQQFFVQDEAP